MTHLSKTSLIPALFLAGLLAGPGSAGAQDSCGQARGQLQGHHVLPFFLGDAGPEPLKIHIEVIIDALGIRQAPLIVVPGDGEIDSDLEQVTVVIGSRTFVKTVKVKPLFAFFVL